MSIASSFLSAAGRIVSSRNTASTASSEIPADIVAACDLSYGPHADNVLDVYAPKDAADGLPLLVSVHGGAWMYGNKENYRPYCISLAQRGFVVVNFTYRLVPNHKWPAQLEDVCAAFTWALEHAPEYGADPQRLVAVGDSAGGQLLSLYCCCCTNPKLARYHGVVPPERGLPHAVGLNCALVSALEKGSMFGLAHDLFVGEGTREELDAFSPLLHVDATFPPAQLVTSREDIIRKDSEFMDAHLSVLGIPHELVIQESEEGKPLLHVFHLFVETADAKRTNDEQCAFLLEYVSAP